MLKIILPLALAITIFAACSTSNKFVYKDIPNTPMPGFDLQGSDTQAIALADSVMKAVGGRNQWDMTHYLRWTFLGKRSLTWDKWGEKVRIDFLDKDLRILLNMQDMTGSVRKQGVVFTEPDSLKKYLQMGKEVWINDSYWVFMPFKLKDSGVTLKYEGEKDNLVGAKCQVVRMTFKGVGVTPNNKYLIWINPSSHLITQWAYFPKATDEKPMFQLPWQDYRAMGHIMLSGNRGEGKSMAPMGVYTAVPDSVFTSFKEIDWTKMK